MVQPAAVLCRLGIVSHVRIFEDAAYLAECAPSPHRLRGLIAISRAIETEIRSYPALAPIPLHTVYDAYVPSVLAELTNETEAKARRIACVGRLVPIKGQDILVRALAMVQEIHPA